MNNFLNSLKEDFMMRKKNQLWGWRVQEHMSFFQKTQVLFPAPTWQITNVYNSSMHRYAKKAEYLYT